MTFIAEAGDILLLLYYVVTIGIFALIDRIARRRVPLVERRIIRVGRVCMKGLRIGRLYLCPRWGTLCIIEPVVGNMVMPGIIFGFARWHFFPSTGERN